MQAPRRANPKLWVLIATLLLWPLGNPQLAQGQQGGSAPDSIRREIQDSQRRLNQVRDERAQLQRDMERLRTQVRDVAGELQNIERQLSATRSAMAEVDFQVARVVERTRRTSRELLETRNALREREAILNYRLRGIYKEGPLPTLRVLLGAESFTNLIHRVRYMQQLAQQDRLMVASVQELEASLTRQSQSLQESLAELGTLRRDQLSEVAELRIIEEERQRTLSQFRTSERQTLSRLDRLAADEARLNSVVRDLERLRLEAEARLAAERAAAAAAAAAAAGAPPGTPVPTPAPATMAAAPLAATLSDADRGRLPWPVQGDIVYRFGPERRPNGTVLRWNGVGIRAPVGTPVTAVRDGLVVLAGPFEGYGPTVILSHGGGFYTLYLYLEELNVLQGRTVRAGERIGTVGGAGTPEGARLEFQIRTPAPGGTPQARDPAEWLSRQQGRSP
jgi:septal ring factor EnvC (AmiA/AmiB activator)